MCPAIPRKRWEKSFGLAEVLVAVPGKQRLDVICFRDPFGCKEIHQAPLHTAKLDVGDGVADRDHL